MIFILLYNLMSFYLDNFNVLGEVFPDYLTIFPEP